MKNIFKQLTDKSTYKLNKVQLFAIWFGILVLAPLAAYLGILIGRAL